MPAAGNLPTIFESLLYPLTSDILVSQTSVTEEQDLFQGVEIIDEVQPVSASSQSRKSKIEV